MVARPSRLLHSTDAGATWTIIPLSSKLPGNPFKILALPEEGTAEMVTDKGAIYKTSDTASTWKA